MIGHFKMLNYSAERRPQLTFEIEDLNKEDLDKWQGKSLIIDVKINKRPRSQDANRKMWAECGKIAEVTDIPAVEVYRKAIKDVGVWRDFTLMSEGEAKTLATAWGRLGIGWLTERVDYAADGEGVILRCYYGSSSYNADQMRRLIDYIEDDCKALGIDVMTDRERSLLIQQWSELKKEGKNHA